MAYEVCIGYHMHVTRFKRFIGGMSLSLVIPIAVKVRD
jgi:hypothetical protein